MLWLSLPSAQGASTDLALLFLFLAEVFWPIYAPIAVALIEPSKSRRRLVYLCLAVGVGVGAHLLWSILTQAQDVMILNGHITYMTKHEHTNVVVGAYLIATCLPLLVSSHRAVAAVGATVLIGYATAFIFYWQAFVSVWCFFAAAASILILLHFELERRQSLLTAGA
jgi:hypothetical protein